MGNFIVASILLSAVIIFTGINSFIICNICDEIISLAEQGKIQEAVALWEEKSGYISIFVRDTEIDVANDGAGQLSQSESFKDEKAKAGIIKFKEAIEEIKNCEKTDFQNIF